MDVYSLQALIEYETVTIEEINLIIEGRANDIPAVRAALKKNQKKFEARGQKILKQIKNVKSATLNSSTTKKPKTEPNKMINPFI